MNLPADLEHVEVLDHQNNDCGKKCRICECERAPTLPAPSLEERVTVLEAQVRSLQLAAPRGIE